MQRPILTLRDEPTALKLAADADCSASVEENNDDSKTYYVVKADIPDTEKLVTAAAAVEASKIVVCPECESRNVEYPERPENSPTMKAAATLIEKISPGDSQKLHCNHCGYSWSE